MSLQITIGLTAGVFAVVVTLLPKWGDNAVFNSATKGGLVIVVCLYTILQLLLLANYLFHTFLLMIHWLGPLELSQKLDKVINEKVLQNLHQNQRPPTPFKKTSAGILNCFQPLIIYFSAFIGVLACWGVAWYLFPPIGSWPCRFFVIVGIVLLGVLITLGFFHTKVETLAKCWFQLHVTRENKSLPHLFKNLLTQPIRLLPKRSKKGG